MLSYLRVVWWRDAIHEARNLRAQVGDADELLQQVLGQHIGEAGLPDVVGVHVDVVYPQMQVGCTDGPDPPVCLAAEQRLFVGGGGGDSELVPVDVLGLGSQGSHLGSRSRLLLDLGDLLALHAGWRDFRAQNDVPDLILRVSRKTSTFLPGNLKQDADALVSQLPWRNHKVLLAMR